jgi:hypothetical protein
MEMSSWLQAPAALPPGEKYPALIKKRLAGFSGPVWTL